MNRFFISVSLLLFIFLLIDCNSPDKDSEKQEKGNSAFKTTSELAELMRIMQTETETLKESIIHGKPLPPLRKEFRNIYTATPTNLAIQGEEFKVFSDEYLAATDECY